MFHLSIRGHEVCVFLLSALHCDKMLTMTDNIHHFWIPPVTLWIYGKDFTMGGQFTRSSDVTRRKVKPGAEAVPDISSEVERCRIIRKDTIFEMIPTNCALSTVAIMSLLSCVMLQGVQAGLVEDFSHAERCKDSLYMGTPPRGYFSSSFQKICQKYENKPRYVTLYDPHKRIPIYSAYTFKKSDGKTMVDFPWMFEPQVSFY